MKFRLEEEKRKKSEELAARRADQSRLAAQLEVLEQAEESLQGYAEGARFLLDAARQSKLRERRFERIAGGARRTRNRHRRHAG